MKLKHNRIETANPVTDDLILQVKKLQIIGEFGTLDLDGSPVAAAPSTNVAIYDPDIVASDGNRYKTWAEVMAQVTLWGNVGGEVVIKKTGVFQLVSIPAGTYNLGSVWLKTDASSILPILSFADGTTLTGFPRVVEELILEGNNDTISTSPLYTAGVFGICVLRDGSIRNSAAATKPVISVPTGTNLTLVSDTSTSPLYRDGGPGIEPVFVEGTLAIDIWRLPDNSFYTINNIFTNALSGNGNINITSHMLLPGGVTRTDDNYDGNYNFIQKAETRVQEKINASLATALVDQEVWRKRSGVYLAPAASNYLVLGYLPGFSPGADTIPASESWDFEVVIFAYYRSTPNAVPNFVSKTCKYTMIHDATTGTVAVALTVVATNGTLPITITAGGGGAAPQHPHIFVQNDDTHSIAVEWKWTRMKSSVPVTNS